ncbi:hypothetical protein ACFX13_009678 [Malus domestica]
MGPITLVNMYCRCGELQNAYKLFDGMPVRNVVSWTAIISGFAQAWQHGLALQAIDPFEEMKRQGVKPDAITLLGVLSSCRHAGLVKEGRLYFNSMFKEQGIHREPDHYSCVVDLLGRAGLLEEAQEFIEKMPIRANAVIWGSLLSSCRLLLEQSVLQHTFNWQTCMLAWDVGTGQQECFRAEDCSNPKMIEIIDLLDSLADHIKTLGYVAEMEEDDH